MNRRSFLKRILGTVAFVAAVEVGLGNLTVDALPEPAQVIDLKGFQYLVTSSGSYYGIRRKDYSTLTAK